MCECTEWEDTPIDRRLVRNAACCRRCGEEIESTHRHDFKWCSCKGIFVDGGLSYARRGGELIGDYDELSEYDDGTGL